MGASDVGRVFVQVFDVALESWAGLPQSCASLHPPAARRWSIEHNGDLYSCDHFRLSGEQAGQHHGTSRLQGLLNSQQQMPFRRCQEPALPTDCLQCDVRFACNGECPKHRFTTTASGEYGLNYLCAGYKHFFHHIDPYMRFMANELGARARACARDGVGSHAGTARFHMVQQGENRMLPFSPSRVCCC